MTDDRSDEGRSTPSVPDSGAGADDTAETADADHDDGTVRDPAGVGGQSVEDSTGLSGQPDADEFESATDWSDVDDGGSSSGPDTDAQSPVDAGRRGPATNTGPGDGVDAPSNVPQGTRAGSPGQGQAGAGGAQTGGGTGGAQTGGAQRGPGEKFCSNCGSVISEQAVVCPDCGVEQPSAQGTGAQGGGGNGSDPTVAALLSAIGLLIPLASGAGQLYNGDVGKAVLFTVLQLFNVGLLFVLVGFLTYPVVGVIAIWDAYASADG
jgi:TM2 domain-containing membrane protein YozV